MILILLIVLSVYNGAVGLGANMHGNRYIYL